MNEGKMLRSLKIRVDWLEKRILEKKGKEQPASYDLQERAALKEIIDRYTTLRDGMGSLFPWGAEHHGTSAVEDRIADLKKLRLPS